MTQEQLRMQMLAGIITEGQYKEKMEEADSYSRVGKQYPAPGYEDMKKGEKKELKREIDIQSRTAKWKKMIFDLYNDASQGLIFVSQPPENIDTDYDAVYVDENSKYKNLLTGKYNEGLGAIRSTHQKVLPKSEAPSPPYKLDFDNFYRIIRAVLQSGADGSMYQVKFLPDFISSTGVDMVQIGYVGYVIDTSSKEFKRSDPDFGFPEKINNEMSWVSFRFRD